MFTLKFYKTYESGQTVNIGVCCPTYEVRRYSDGAVAVIVYKGFTHTDGVEYWVGGEREDAYDQLFIENQAGKTIDRVSGGDLRRAIGLP